MFRRAIAIACAAAIGGCATASPPPTASAAPPAAWVPTVDPRGVNQARYQKDLAECQVLARSVPGSDAKTEARKGAVRGGVGTAVALGAATVLTGGLAAVAALPALAGSAALSVGGGALGAGYAGKAVADGKYRSALAACLANRGYHVLG